MTAGSTWTASEGDAAGEALNLKEKPVSGYKFTDSFHADAAAISALLELPPHPSLASSKAGDSKSTVAIRNLVVDAASLKIYLHVLSHTSRITTLDFFNAGISAEGVRAIADALPILPCSTLKLDYNPLKSWEQEDQDASPRFALLVRPSLLRTLSLRGNGITDSGATAIAAALEDITLPLASLNLFDNAIGDAGAAAIADSLKINGILAGLSLSRNRLGPAAAASCEALLTGYILDEPVRTKRATADERIAAANKAVADAAKKKKSAAPVPMPALAAATVRPDGTAFVRGTRTLAILNLGNNPGIGHDAAAALVRALAACAAVGAAATGSQEKGEVVAGTGEGGAGFGGLHSLCLQRTGAIASELAAELEALARTTEVIL